MQKLGLPRQLFWIALLLAPTGSSLALISRYRLDATVNTIFKAITFNNQSLIEHFLISLAASGIALLIIMLAFRDKKVLFPKGLIRARWITGVRRKLMPLFSEVFITKWLVVLSSMYVAATFPGSTLRCRRVALSKADRFQWTSWGAWCVAVPYGCACEKSMPMRVCTADYRLSEIATT
jgi:hypothetical protein